MDVLAKYWALLQFKPTGALHLAVVKLLKMCVKTSTTITTKPLVSAYADLKFALTMNFLTLTSACANADQRSVQKVSTGVKKSATASA
jgi:hypothetical protein